MILSTLKLRAILQLHWSRDNTIRKLVHDYQKLYGTCTYLATERVGSLKCKWAVVEVSVRSGIQVTERTGSAQEEQSSDIQHWRLQAVHVNGCSEPGILAILRVSVSLLTAPHCRHVWLSE